MAFLILNNIYKPIRRFHATIIATMNEIKIPFSEFTFSYSRSSGAGGQNVNKVNSKVILNWNIDLTSSCSPAVIDRFKKKYGHFILDSGVVQIVGQRFRSQKDNVEDCIEKLQNMINEVMAPPKIRRATKPKKSAILNRLKSKKKESDKKKMRKKDF